MVSPLTLERHKMATPNEARMLGHSRHALAEHKQNRWFVTVESDVTKEDLLRPSYWAPMSARGEVRPCDEIVVFPDSGEWRILLHVVMANHSGMMVAVLQETSFAEQVKSAESDPIGFDVAWRGPHAQFAIINRANKEVVKDRIPSKEQAFQMIRDMANPKAA
jgi:hypothetical protein